MAWYFCKFHPLQGLYNRGRGIYYDNRDPAVGPAFWDFHSVSQIVLSRYGIINAMEATSSALYFSMMKTTYIISIQGTPQTFRFLVQWVNKNILVRYICTFNGLWQYTRRDIIQSTQSRNCWWKTMIHFLVFFVDRHKVHSQVHRVNLLPLVKCFIVFLLSIL